MSHQSLCSVAGFKLRPPLYDSQNNTNNYYYAGNGNTLTLPKHPQDRLEEYVSKGATHDSAECGTDAPKCHPETREAVQGKMLTHIEYGKTKVRYFIPTLAYHLLQLNIPGLRMAIIASIEAHPSVFDKRLDQQVEILILAPIRKLHETTDTTTWLKAIIIDGVDECGPDKEREYETENERQISRENNQREVLSALVQATNDPSFPFRIVVASRPERAIENFFSPLLSAGMVKKLFLDSEYKPEANIELYARAMLNKIGMDYGLPTIWYSQVGQALQIADIPRYWAQEASGQFVYAATVIRYIQDKSGPPHKQLECVLNWRPSNTSNPFAALNVVYTGILRTSPEPILAVKWLHSIISFTKSYYTPWYMKRLLESYPGETGYLLGPLASLIRITDKDGEPDFHFYHKSLSDFLDDPLRSGAFSIPGDGVFRFQVDRYIELIEEVDKGPQGQLPPKETLDAVLRVFCGKITDWIQWPHEKQYDASHIHWWFSHLLRDEARAAVFLAF
ncbi:hypothetical protein FA13DRAFT_1717400 [Coprinellus micaceus]|uniref:NACHT domain-containing protein n=1 Tax=Coprinellus micaceus TaxID=71717 RepID=A0A4Y7SGX0_COPMI|nr:hypothetical protein FA13DRAFT_1717400 [Coprinellus micaceus]